MDINKLKEFLRHKIDQNKMDAEAVEQNGNTEASKLLRGKMAAFQEVVVAIENDEEDAAGNEGGELTGP